MLDLLLLMDKTLTALIYNLPHFKIIDIFFEFMSILGNYGIIWIIFAVYIIVYEERKNHQFIKIFIISTLLTFLLTNYILKNIFIRPRPLSIYYQNSIQKDKYPKDFSFPSGHASSAFAAAYVLAKFDEKKRSLFYIIAFLIALSRVYLGFHYFLDVVTGSIIGTVISYFVYNKMYEKIKFKTTSRTN